MFEQSQSFLEQHSGLTARDKLDFVVSCRAYRHGIDTVRLNQTPREASEGKSGLRVSVQDDDSTSNCNANDVQFVSF